VPGFPAFMSNVIDKELVTELGSKFGAGDARLYRAKTPDSSITLYVIDAPDLFNRPGNPYADANNQAYADNYRRFALLGWVAAQLAGSLDSEWSAEVVHGHDWHAGLAPAYLKAEEIRTGQKLAHQFSLYII
jgi:starch synthase